MIWMSNSINRLGVGPKTKLFLRKKFIEAARLQGHRVHVSLISDYDEDLYNDPIIEFDRNNDNSLSVRDMYVIFENELVPNKHRYWNKDLKAYSYSEDINAYIWLPEADMDEEWSTLRKLIGSVVRWNYYDETYHYLDNSKSYRITDIQSSESYVLLATLKPYIETTTPEIKSESSNSNFSFTKD